MSSSSTVTTSDGGNNQLARRSYTCHECNMIMEILSSSSSPPHCPLCNRISSFTSLTPYQVGLDEDEEDETSQFSIPTIEISSLMLGSSPSEDSALSCAICREDFVVGESAHRLPCNHLYHCDCIIPWITSHNSCPLCRFEIPVAASGDDGGLTMLFDQLALENAAWEEELRVALDNFDQLALENAWEEEMRVTLDNLDQTFDG